jgi:hypothetical protein
MVCGFDGTPAGLRHACHCERPPPPVARAFSKGHHALNLCLPVNLNRRAIRRRTCVTPDRCCLLTSCLASSNGRNEPRPWPNQSAQDTQSRAYVCSGCAGTSHGRPRHFRHCGTRGRRVLSEGRGSELSGGTHARRPNPSLPSSAPAAHSRGAASWPAPLLPRTAENCHAWVCPRHNPTNRAMTPTHSCTSGNPQAVR